VTIYEACTKPAGFWSMDPGIPPPQSHCPGGGDYLAKLGVEIRTNQVIGQVNTVDELLAEGMMPSSRNGRRLPNFHEYPGENLNGVTRPTNT